MLAQAINGADTPGVDWIELVLQVAVAAVGVTVVGSLNGRSRR